MGPANENNNKQLWIIREMGAGSIMIFSAVPNLPLTMENDNIFATHKLTSGNQTWFIDNTVYNSLKIMLSKLKGKYLGYENYRVKMRSIPQNMADTWEFVKV